MVADNHFRNWVGVIEDCYPVPFVGTGYLVRFGNDDIMLTYDSRDFELTAREV